MHRQEEALPLPGVLWGSWGSVLPTGPQAAFGRDQAVPQIEQVMGHSWGSRLLRGGAVQEDGGPSREEDGGEPGLRGSGP